MSERSVLASCLASRDAWQKVAMHVEDRELTEQGKIILAHVSEYYDLDPEATRCDPDIIARSIGRTMSNPKHEETFNNLVADLASTEVSPPNVVKDLIAVKRDAVGAELATALAAGRDVEYCRDLIARFEELAEAETLESPEEDEGICAMSLDDMLEMTAEGSLIPVWPTALNERLDGGLLRGNHLVVFARPEAGKTLFVVNMLAGFVSHGYRVLYIGNEEPCATTSQRLFTRLVNKPYNEMDKTQSPELMSLALSRGYGNVRFFDLTPGNLRQLDRLLTRFPSDVLVLDQLRNLDGGDDNFVRVLEAVAKGARNLGKRHSCAVVSVTQAGNSAEGKPILDMGDVDSSNTGIPATADVMVGIGGTHEDMHRDRRIISLPKNKRTGRHDFFPVQLVPALSKVRSID